MTIGHLDALLTPMEVWLTVDALVNGRSVDTLADIISGDTLADRHWIGTFKRIGVLFSLSGNHPCVCDYRWVEKVTHEMPFLVAYKSLRRLVRRSVGPSVHRLVTLF